MPEIFQDNEPETNSYQQNQSDASQGEGKENVKDVDIYVMPEKMIAPQKQKKSHKTIFIVVGALLAVIAFGGIVFFVLNKKLKELNIKTPISSTENVKTQNTVAAEEETNIGKTEESQKEIVSPENKEPTSNTTQESPINYLTSTTTEALSAGQDTDKDSLTDEEEKIYKTDAQKPDSDEDGYLDGAEIINLYNPLVKSLKIDTSGLVNIYINPIFKYSLFYPAGWIARALDQSNATIIFTSSTGEFIEVLVLENPQKLFIFDWYKEQYFNVNLEEIKKIKVAGQEAIEVFDKENGQKIVYFSNNDKVYGLIYNYGSKEGLNFETTFEMMKNSFKL